MSVRSGGPVVAWGASGSVWAAGGPTPVFGSGEATSGVLSPFWAHQCKKKYRRGSKGHKKDGEGSGASLL